MQINPTTNNNTYGIYISYKFYIQIFGFVCLCLYFFWRALHGFSYMY